MNDSERIAILEKRVDELFNMILTRQAEAADSVEQIVEYILRCGKKGAPPSVIMRRKNSKEFFDRIRQTREIVLCREGHEKAGRPRRRLVHKKFLSPTQADLPPESEIEKFGVAKNH